MFGYLIWRGEGRPRVILEQRAIGGVTFCVLEARGRERRVTRRVLRALGAMEEWGIRRYVVEPDWPRAWREDLAEVEEDTLRQALFPQLLDWLSAQGRLTLDGAAVELSAPWASRAVWEAARVLSRRCRYLRLRLEGADALRQDLWRRYGIAAGGGGEGPAALQVCFGEPAGDAPALLLGPGCGRAQQAAYAVPESLTADLGTCPLTPQLLAALWQCGAVRTEEIRLASLDFPA